MKQKSTGAMSIGALVFCIALSGTKLLAQSAPADKGPITLTASLAGASTVAFGEPVLLKYVVKNSSDLPVVVSTTDTKGDVLGTESFAEVGGKLLIPSASLLVPHHHSETLVLYGGLDLRRNSSKSWEAFANARITFPHPGSYILRVHVERPYVAGDSQQGTRGILRGDYVFPVNVVPANPAYLHSAARSLREGILRTTDADEKAALVQALFSMPEFAASSSWQALIEEPKLDGKTLNEIGTALEGLQTNRAADLLAEMFWEVAQSPDTVAQASVFEHFYGMYDAGTPAIKKHIEDLHKQHGVAMSHYRLE